MGAATSCCWHRDADLTHPGTPPLLRDACSANDVFASGASPSSRRPERRRLSKQQSLDLEWDIISSSIDAEEFNRLRALRRAVMDCDTHPACIEKMLSCQPQTLLRFLRGREGDLVKAEEMFRASLDWRCSFKVDEKVRAWEQELAEGMSPRARLVQKYGVDAQPCTDKWGVPVWLMRLGCGDPAGLLRELGEEAVLIERLAQMEAMHAELRRAMFKNRALVRGCIQVIDVGDYREYGTPNWWSRMLEGFKIGKAQFRVFEANYPETTRKIFFVRMGKVTHSLYKMALPIIPARTKTKMRLFGPQASTWRQEMQDEVMPGEVLPAFLTCDTPEAFASAQPKGGIVPVGSGLGKASPPLQDQGVTLRRCVTEHEDKFDRMEHEPVNSARARARSKSVPALAHAPPSGDAIKPRTPSWWVLILGFFLIAWMVVSTSAMRHHNLIEA